MTPEELENQYSDLSSHNQDYSQERERERERERVTSFNRKNIFRKIFSLISTKLNSITPVTSNRFIVLPLLGRKPSPSQGLLFLKLSLIQLYHSTFQSLSSGFKFGIGFILALFTAGLLAVTVSGTFNTFSSGTLLKSSDLNTNFATLKAAIESIPSQPSMRLIYETDTNVSLQQVLISGLDGNTDMEYQIKLRMIGNSGPSDLNILLNGDITTTNYGTQDIYAGGTGTPGMSQLTSSLGLTCGGLGNGLVSSCNMEIIAKSGSSRLAMAVLNQQVSGTSMAYTRYAGSVWNNSSSNITSITIYSSIVNGIGAGSHIEVWARR